MTDATSTEGRRERAKELLAAADETPAAVDPDAIPEFVDAEPGICRIAAARVATVVTREDPDRVVSHAEDLWQLLEDDVLAVRSEAALTAAALARERPDAVRQALPALVDALDEDPPVFRFRAAGAVAPLVADDPSAFLDHVPELIGVLVDDSALDDATTDPDEGDVRDRQRHASTMRSRGTEAGTDRTRSADVRVVVGNALVAIARRYPERLIDRVETLSTALDDTDPAVRAAVVAALAALAEHDPDRIRTTAAEDLMGVLDDSDPTVRARAVGALGSANATGAIDRLEEIAESDSDEEVAALADEAVDWLSSLGPTGPRDPQ